MQLLLWFFLIIQQTTRSLLLTRVIGMKTHQSIIICSVKPSEMMAPG